MMMTLKPGRRTDRSVPGGRFLWGCGTSAFQVEGALTSDGRTASVWDLFCEQGDPGYLPEPASDSYRRWAEDAQLAADLGCTSYRFSLAWPRLQPQPTGFDSTALEHYERQVDAVLTAQVEPMVTLSHWDLPQWAMEQLGGWETRQLPAAFASYAAAVAARLGDRVRWWTTVNEPWMVAFLGYANGLHAPGRRDPAAALRVAHHQLLGHAFAVEAIHATHRDTDVGLSLNLAPVHPSSSSPQDIDAARRVDGLQNRLFLDPLYTGSYPADVLVDCAAVSDWSFVKEGDLGAIFSSSDFLGVNYYKGRVVAYAREEQQDSPWPGSPRVRTVPARKGQWVSAMGWPCDDDGLEQLLVDLTTAYGRIPLIVTETGCAVADEVADNDEVADPDRAMFLERYVRAALTAKARGADLRGFMVWSMLDNFEWTFGYSRRFGMVHVDFDTGRRRWKHSAIWFARRSPRSSGLRCVGERVQEVVSD